MNILFKSIKVVDSKSRYHNKTVDVLVEKGFISSIGKSLKSQKLQELKSAVSRFSKTKHLQNLQNLKNLTNLNVTTSKSAIS